MGFLGNLLHFFPLDAERTALPASCQQRCSLENPMKNADLWNR